MSASVTCLLLRRCNKISHPGALSAPSFPVFGHFRPAHRPEATNFRRASPHPIQSLRKGWRVAVRRRLGAETWRLHKKAFPFFVFSFFFFLLLFLLLRVCFDLRAGGGGAGLFGGVLFVLFSVFGWGEGGKTGSMTCGWTKFTNPSQSADSSFRLPFSFLGFMHSNWCNLGFVHSRYFLYRWLLTSPCSWCCGVSFLSGE